MATINTGINFDTLLEAQVEIEVLNDKMPSKSLFKLEAQLRKVILQFRDFGHSAEFTEIQEMIEYMAKANNFKNVDVHYETNTPAPDGKMMLTYEAKLDKFHCFIYVRS